MGHGAEARWGTDSALGELHMTYRAFGNMTSTSGTSYSGLLLNLNKNTAAVMDLQA